MSVENDFIGILILHKLCEDFLFFLSAESTEKI